MRKKSYIWVLTLAFPIAQPVFACDHLPTPQSIVTRSYDSVVMVTITNADYIGPSPITNPSPAFNLKPWRATAKLKQSIEGPSQTGYSFKMHSNPVGCELWKPIAVRGSDWVLYLRRNGSDGSLIVAEAFPLKEVSGIDHRLKTLAKPTR